MYVYVFKYLRLDLYDPNSINCHGYTCTQLKLCEYNALQIVMGGLMNTCIHVQVYTYMYAHVLSYTFKE